VLTQTLDMIRTKLLADPALDESIRLFMTDDLLCNMIMRFVFFEAVAKMHQLFKAPEFQPRSHPAMPSTISSDADVQDGIVELAAILKGSEYIQKE